MLETPETFPYYTELGNASKQPALTPPIYFYTSYNNNNDLINLEYEYKIPPAYTTESNSIPLNHSTQYARYLQYGIYWNGTDPTNEDTDRDGLKDGNELSISNPDPNGVIENPYGNHFGTTLDPLNPDTDGDGIQDGQEYNGYTAVYFKQVGDTNKKLSRKITDADPFSAFKLKDGAWLDTDEDKIPDVIERDPANMTLSIFDNIQNIDNFRWYYNKYKNDANDKNDNNDENNENAKDAIANQFNPNVVECIIPVTDNINVLTNSDVGLTYANAWTDITIDVRDTVGIKKVVLEVTDCNHKVTLYADDAEKLGDGWLRFRTTIDIDFWGDYLLDYTVKVKVIDLNGNSFVTEKKVNGVFGGIINAIVDAVKGFLEDAWEAAKGLVDAIFDFLKEIFETAVRDLIDGITSLFKGMIDEYAHMLKEIIQITPETESSAETKALRLSSSSTTQDDYEVSINQFMLLHLVSGLMDKELLFVGLFGIFMGLEATWMALTGGLGAVASSLLTGALKNVALGLLLGGALTSVVRSVYDAVNDGESDMVSSVLNVFGFGLEFMGLVQSVLDTLKEKGKSSKFLFYAGLSLAFAGFIYSAATATLDFSGEALKMADVIGICISIGGLLLMLFSATKDRGEEAVQEGFPITSLVEWIIGICGVASAVITAANHMAGGDWN